MPGAGSSTDLCNLALLQLHNQPIQSLNDNSIAANACNLVYDTERQALLRNYVWNFARNRGVANLVANPTTGAPAAPLFDFMDIYQLPNDCLRIHWIGYDWTRFCPFPYDLQGDYILFNQQYPGYSTPNFTPWNTLYLKYTSDITDVTQMDALFKKVLVYAIATEICLPVTGDVNLRMALEKKLDQVLREAQAVNHAERPVEVTDRDIIGAARSGYCDEDWLLNVNPSIWPTD